MDVSALSRILLSAAILTTVKVTAQSRDTREGFDDQDYDFWLRDSPFDAQVRQPNDNNEKESRQLDILGLGAIGRYPGNNLGALFGSLGGFPEAHSSNRISGQNINQGLNEGLFRGLPSSLNSLSASQNLINAAPGQIRSNLIGPAGLRGGIPSSLNTFLAPQDLLGAASGQIRNNLIGGPSGLRGGLPGLIAGINGGGDNSPFGNPIGRSPIGDIMAMASFLTKDELNDMFSKDRNFNFIPVILQDNKETQEDQEIQQFIRYLNSRSEKENQSLVSEITGFEKRDQRSLNVNPLLAQQIRGNALLALTQQNLLQSGVNPLLLSQNLLTPGVPNSILS
ncbi:unnamed protein product, partial [Meganyctiphanes norvegica]